MTRPSISSNRAGLAAGLLLALAGTVLLSGCGPSWGAWVYTMGLYPTQKIPAEYQLPKGSFLILVDDDRDLIRPSKAKEVVVDELAKLLKDHKLAEQVTTNEELARLRQEEPRFNERGARELGQAAHADTVLWLNTMDFTLNSDLEMVMNPAKWAVTVRVINAKAEKTEEVRLWPTEREGRLVEITVSPHDIRRCKDLDEAHTLLASTMADEVAKLFYEQEIRGQ
jgi:hypothetical protein